MSNQRRPRSEVAPPIGRRALERTEMMMCGQLPSLAITLSRSIVSVFPTMSSSVLGRCCASITGSVEVSRGGEVGRRGGRGRAEGWVSGTVDWVSSRADDSAPSRPCLRRARAWCQLCRVHRVATRRGRVRTDQGSSYWTGSSCCGCLPLSAVDVDGNCSCWSMVSESRVECQGER